jgi:hypothetical protein
MANPFPFTAGQVLEAAQLNGIGETTSFTPTWSGLTVGNGTLNYATYVLVQNLVFVQVQFTLGSTSAVTGNINITTPVTSSEPTQGIIGNSSFSDVSAGASLTGVVSMVTELLQALPVNAAGTYASTAVTSATVPFTWATGDVVRFTATYRVA